MSVLGNRYYKEMSKPENIDRIKSSVDSFIENDEARSFLDLLLYQGSVNAKKLGINPSFFNIFIKIEREAYLLVQVTFVNKDITRLTI